MDVNNVSEVMKNFSGDNGMPVGIDTAIKALRPGATWEIEMAGGNITYHKWYHKDGLKPPLSKNVDFFITIPLVWKFWYSIKTSFVK